MINFYLSKNSIFINMKLLQELHNLILEKYIGSVTSNIEISIKFDIKKTSHATDQFTRTGIKGYNESPISNSELLEFLNISKSKITEKIASQEIIDGSKFVLKSNDWEMACPIIAKQRGDFKWEMLVLTVFRESPENPFRVGKNQLILWV